MQAATGEDVTAEELGGGELHSTVSGVTDHLAENEAHALSLARHILGNLTPPVPPPSPEVTREWEEPLHPAEELRGLACNLVVCCVPR